MFTSSISNLQKNLILRPIFQNNKDEFDTQERRIEKIERETPSETHSDDENTQLGRKGSKKGLPSISLKENKREREREKDKERERKEGKERDQLK